jgi:hypothetical protein
LKPLEWLPVLGLGLYAANVALGVGLQLRLWSLHRATWVHHALYFAVCVTTLLAGYALVTLERRWWGLLLTVTCLAILPRARGGSRLHRSLTLTGLLAYVLALI